MELEAISETGQLEVLKLRYRPQEGWPPGLHEVTLHVADFNGNSDSIEFSFLIPATEDVEVPILKDTFLLARDQHLNEGANILLTLEKVQGKAVRSAVAFDLSDINLNGLSKATLTLMIAPSEQVNGWGNGRTFTPNTITYSFPEFVKQKIIIAPHTEYFAENDLRDAIAKPFTELLEDNQKVKWVQPSVDYVKYDDKSPTFKTEDVKFLDERTAECCKKIINAFIREGKLLTYEMLTLILDCPKLADLYLILIEMKEDLIDSFIIADCPVASIQGLKVKQEGFVIHGKDGMQTKLVDREVFAKANFTMPKRWTT